MNKKNDGTHIHSYDLFWVISVYGQRNVWLAPKSQNGMQLGYVFMATNPQPKLRNPLLKSIVHLYQQ